MSLKKLLLNLLFPKKCYGCGHNNTWICPACLAAIKLYEGDAPRALENNADLVIAGQYQDKILKELIVAFKFGFNQELALPLFIFLKNALDKKILIDNLSGHDWQKVIVIPLPLHTGRQKWRGFNQSELIAREISNYYNWPISLDLTRPKKNKIQAELQEAARLKNAQGIFKWIGDNLLNQTVLLVDDIITSGATINEAERVLLVAGAKRVIKVALAKG